MAIQAIVLGVLLLLADEPAPPASAQALAALQQLHQTEAGRWQMFLDDKRTRKAEFRAKPIYVWTNPTRSLGQHGAVFVWLTQGRPVAIGSTFSHPEDKRRMLCHEFHSLATDKLRPDHGDAKEQWQPAAAVEMKPLPGAPQPGETPAKRLSQMRAMARDFSAHSIDYQKERWTLRLLTQPLYRYEKPEGEVTDGALFAFVTSAGTDPEVIVALEAREVKGELAWHYRPLRFSDSNLFVQYQGDKIWSSVRDDKHTLHFNPDHTYRLIRDRYLDELPELSEESPK
jgi:hypothetical protein